MVVCQQNIDNLDVVIKYNSVPSQSKYKEGSRRRLSQSFYSQLPETAETQFAKAVAELQSEVRAFRKPKTHLPRPAVCAWVHWRVISSLDTIQGRGEEGRELLFVLSSTGDVGDGSRQGSLWAPESGTGPEHRTANTCVLCCSRSQSPSPVHCRWSIKRRVRRRWAWTCSLCYLRPSTPNTLRRRQSQLQSQVLIPLSIILRFKPIMWDGINWFDLGGQNPVDYV